MICGCADRVLKWDPRSASERCQWGDLLTEFQREMPLRRVPHGELRPAAVKFWPHEIGSRLPVVNVVVVRVLELRGCYRMYYPPQDPADQAKLEKEQQKGRSSILAGASASRGAMKDGRSDVSARLCDRPAEMAVTGVGIDKGGRQSVQRS